MFCWKGAGGRETANVLNILIEQVGVFLLAQRQQRFSSDRRRRRALSLVDVGLYHFLKRDKTFASCSRGKK